MKIPDILNRIRRHSELFETMANKLRVRDRLIQVSGNAGVYRRASMRCLSCRNADACEQWLDLAREPDEAPGYCRNRALFARLARLDSTGVGSDGHGSGPRPTEQAL